MIVPWVNINQLWQAHGVNLQDWVNMLEVKVLPQLLDVLQEHIQTRLGKQHVWNVSQEVKAPQTSPVVTYVPLEKVNLDPLRNVRTVVKDQYLERGQIHVYHVTVTPAAGRVLCNANAFPDIIVCQRVHLPLIFMASFKIPTLAIEEAIPC